jgi:hypothetical protein
MAVLKFHTHETSLIFHWTSMGVDTLQINPSVHMAGSFRESSKSFFEID